MDLSPREELHQLIDKLPESKVEELLNLAKKDTDNKEFIFNNLGENIDKIMDKYDNLLKRLAQ